MDKLALILGDHFIYWNSIVLTLAAVTAILFFLSFYIGKSGNAVAGFAAIPMCLVLIWLLPKRKKTAVFTAVFPAY